MSTETFKSTAAKILVPFLVGCVPGAFLAGRALGGDSRRLEIVERSVEGMEAKVSRITSIQTDIEWIKTVLTRIEGKMGR